MYFPLIVYDPLNSPLTIYDISHLADKILSSSKCYKVSLTKSKARDFLHFFSKIHFVVQILFTNIQKKTTNCAYLQKKKMNS